MKTRDFHDENPIFQTLRAAVAAHVPHNDNTAPQREIFAEWEATIRDSQKKSATAPATAWKFGTVSTAILSGTWLCLWAAAGKEWVSLEYSAAAGVLSLGVFAGVWVRRAWEGLRWRHFPKEERSRTLLQSGMRDRVFRPLQSQFLMASERLVHNDVPEEIPDLIARMADVASVHRELQLKLVLLEAGFTDGTRTNAYRATNAMVISCSVALAAALGAGIAEWQFKVGFDWVDAAIAGVATMVSTAMAMAYAKSQKAWRHSMITAIQAIREETHAELVERFVDIMKGWGFDTISELQEWMDGAIARGNWSDRRRGTVQPAEDKSAPISSEDETIH